MTDNTANALKYYKGLLKRLKLEEGKEYTANFELKSWLETSKIEKIKPLICIDKFELSPLLSIECYSKEWVGNLCIMNKEYILDKYDRDAIKEEFDEVLHVESYDAKILSKLLDKMKVMV